MIIKNSPVDSKSAGGSGLQINSAGLVGCVCPDGKLGYVQPIGADPHQVDANQTDIYGVGSFLLAGSEVYKIAIRHSPQAPIL
jgi:unsaturated rhamnogalacturonyl hydrolase